MTNTKDDIWLVESFSVEEPHPSWPCPICNIGTLKGDKKTIQTQQSQDTRKARKPSSPSATGKPVFRFAGFLTCNNSKCKEKIVIAGNGIIYAKSTKSIANINYQGARYGVYYPRYFEPPLQIFPVYDSCPIEIRDQINRSFAHYFNDLSASANSIRTALELIMNDRKVKEGRLHSRITEFGKNYPTLKPFLLATKWIGNAGSHVGDITKEDVLLGYQLLEYCLDELYVRPARLKELSPKADNINKSRKPLGNKKK